MAESRCPMCSRANPEDLEECQYCGARLKPLVAGDSPASPEQASREPQDSEQPESEDQIPDWLARIRARASEEQEDEDQLEESADHEVAGPSGSPDWLSRLREVEPEEVGPPPGEVPDWALQETEETEEPEEPEEPGDQTVPESDSGEGWLDRLRPQEEPSPGEIEPQPPESISGPPQDVPAEFEDEEELSPSAELPGWLDEISDEVPPLGEVGDWDDDLSEVDRSTGDQLEREFEDASEFDIGADQGEGLTVAPEEDLEEPLEARSRLEPDDEQDLFSLRDRDLSAIEPDSGDDDRDREPDSEPFTEGFDELETDLPDWLDELEADEESFESEPALEDLEAAELPDWVEQAQPPSAAEPVDSADSEFEWELDDYPPPEPEEEQVPDLPHVPAFDAQGLDREPELDSDLDLDAIELPEWLSDIRQDKEVSDLEAPAERPNLAPATIPNWLEAMRPVETIQPVVDLDSDEVEETVESVGPLAGLRGVLMAEPVVAKPRTSTTAATGLEVSERQYAQADLLRRIVEDEQRELTGIAGRRRRWPIVRWILALVVIAAVGLIPISGVIRFAIPTVISRDLGAVVEQVNAVPVERPVLMVFDYEPGYSSEVQAVAGPLMEHLFRRDLNVVTVSSQPTGPPLALELVGRAAQDHGAEGGRDFLHLGYLSGGPSAVQLFSADPRFAVLDGFMIPEDFRDQPLWEQPLLREVRGLSDFGMVIVIASGTDSARVWAEQAPPWLGDTPLLMVLSAGAEPLIRPYFEALNPTVNGILTGLPAGVYYEQLNGKPGLAEQRWSSFGIGSFVIELAMLAGLAWGGFWWVMDYREKRAQR